MSSRFNQHMAFDNSRVAFSHYYSFAPHVNHNNHYSHAECFAETFGLQELWNLVCTSVTVIHLDVGYDWNCCFLFMYANLHYYLEYAPKLKYWHYNSQLYTIRLWIIFITNMKFRYVIVLPFAGIKPLCTSFGSEFRWSVELVSSWFVL